MSTSSTALLTGRLLLVVVCSSLSTDCFASAGNEQTFKGSYRIALIVSTAGLSAPRRCQQVACDSLLPVKGSASLFISSTPWSFVLRLRTCILFKEVMLFALLLTDTVLSCANGEHEHEREVVIAVCR